MWGDRSTDCRPSPVLFLNMTYPEPLREPPTPPPPSASHELGVTSAGEIIKSLRLSEARLLLSRYSRTKDASNVVAEDGPSVPSNTNADSRVSAAAEVSGARHRGLEERFMELLSRAVDSLTQVGGERGVCDTST